MSVIMTLQVTGNAKAMEQWAQDNPAKMQEVLEAAKRHGLIAHRFYGSEDGTQLMVLDEWPDRASFEAFFQEQGAEIKPMFESVESSEQPEPVYWQEMSTGDAHGWSG